RDIEATEADSARRGKAGASHPIKRSTWTILGRVAPLAARDLAAKHQVTLDRTVPPGITMKHDGCRANSPLAEPSFGNPALPNPAIYEAPRALYSAGDGGMRIRVGAAQEYATN